MKKKMVSALLVAAMTMSCLAGCGSSASGDNSAAAGTADAGAAAEQETTGKEKNTSGEEINLAIALADEEWNVMNKVCDKFYEETGIKVNGINVENEDIESKMDSLAQAGKAEIDVVCPDNMLLAGLVNKGLVYDLSDYEDQIPAEISKNLYEDFKVDGKLYYLPFRPNVKLEFYDEDKFNEYGLEVPETWEDVKDVAKTFYDQEGIARFGYMAKNGGATTVTLFELIRSYGGDPTVLNDGGSVKAFQILQDLWPYTSTEVTTTSYAQMNQFLADGTVYMGENWPYCAVVVVKDNGKSNVKAYVGPAGSEGVNKVLGGNVVAIASNTEHFDASLQFVEYLMSKEVQEIFCTDMGWIPARSDAIGAAEEWQQEYLDVAMEALSYAKPRPILSYWSSVDKAINDAYIEIVVNQNKDIQGVLDAQHQNIEDAKAAAE